MKSYTLFQTGKTTHHRLRTVTGVGLGMELEMGLGTYGLVDNGAETVVVLTPFGRFLASCGKAVWSGAGVGIKPIYESWKMSFCAPSKKLYKLV
jgi:hypothetical protein